MRQDRDLTGDDTRGSTARIDPPDCGRSLPNPDPLVQMGHRARQEAERFINGHIADSTKGWPLLSREHGPDRKASCPP